VEHQGTFQGFGILVALVAEQNTEQGKSFGQRDSIGGKQYYMSLL